MILQHQQEQQEAQSPPPAKRGRGRRKATTETQENTVEPPPFIPSWDEKTVDTIVDEKRSNKESYRWFYCEVLKYSGSLFAWRKNIDTGDKKVVELSTASNEALCLLIVENYWGNWRAKSENQEEEDVKELTAPKYTDPKRQRDSWKDEGIERFNELFEEVKEDRNSTEGKAFDNWFQEQMKANHSLLMEGKKKKSKTKSVNVSGRPSATIELWSDDDSVDVSETPSKKTRGEDKSDGEEDEHEESDDDENGSHSQVPV